MRAFSAAIAVVLALACTPSPSAEVNAEGKVIVIPIGIDGYKDMPALTAARNDAKAIERVFLDSIGAAKENVTLLVDDRAAPEDAPTLSNIQKRIADSAASAAENDTVIVFFSGHVAIKGDDAFMVPVEGVGKVLDLNWIADRLVESNARSTILILDGCHVPGTSSGLCRIAPSLVEDSDNFTVILSCAAGQTSRTDAENTRGVFAQYFVEGLGGEADSNGDNQVTLAEAFEYVCVRMKRWEGETGGVQQPLLIGVADSSAGLTRVPGKGTLEVKTSIAKPTLNVKAIDAETGAELAGLNVCVDGQKVGVTPLKGFEVKAGASVKVEVTGQGLLSYTQYLVISNTGSQSVTAGLVRLPAPETTPATTEKRTIKVTPRQPPAGRRQPAPNRRGPRSPTAFPGDAQ